MIGVQWAVSWQSLFFGTAISERATQWKLTWNNCSSGVLCVAGQWNVPWIRYTGARYDTFIVGVTQKLPRWPCTRTSTRLEPWNYSALYSVITGERVFSGVTIAASFQFEHQIRTNSNTNSQAAPWSVEWTVDPAEQLMQRSVDWLTWQWQVVSSN